MLFISLCLTVAVLCWAVTALLVALLWRGSRGVMNILSPAMAADCLFLLEILPLLSSAILLSLFVIPGFAVWEPDHTSEKVSIWMVAPSVFALALICIALKRLYFELRSLPVILPDRPFVGVLGCLRQRVVITDATLTLLSKEELQAVLRHEAAHIERRDNCRLLAARFVSMLTLSPRCWREMESARARLTEFAADSSAAPDECSALDLAQALVKIARVFPRANYRFASSLVPGGSSIQERVLRLLKGGPSQPPNAMHLAVIAVPLLAAIATAVLHHDLQYFCYRILERLVSL